MPKKIDLGWIDLVAILIIAVVLYTLVQIVHFVLAILITVIVGVFLLKLLNRWL